MSSANLVGEGCLMKRRRARLICRPNVHLARIVQRPHLARISEDFGDDAARVRILSEHYALRGYVDFVHLAGAHAQPDSFAFIFHIFRWSES